LVWPAGHDRCGLQRKGDERRPCGWLACATTMCGSGSGGVRQERQCLSSLCPRHRGRLSLCEGGAAEGKFMLGPRIWGWSGTVHGYLGYQKNHLRSHDTKSCYFHTKYTHVQPRDQTQDHQHRALLPYHGILKSLITTWRIKLFCIYLVINIWNLNRTQIKK
jgi:hypothetical protein